MARRYTAMTLSVLVLTGVGTSMPASANGKLSASVAALAKQCAPGVAPETVAYLVSHESGNNPFAVHVNKVPWSKQPKTRTFEEAKAVVEQLTREGASFDTGYGQIWSGNLEALGVSAVDMLQPCKNLSSLERILTDCYRVALQSHTSQQTALRHALSCYNTGNQEDGFTNGYVGKILAVAQANDTLKVPALRVDGIEGEESAAAPNDEPAVAEPAPKPVQQGIADGFSEPSPEGFANPAPGGFEAAQREDGAPHEGLSHPTKAIRGTERTEQADQDDSAEGER